MAVSEEFVEKLTGWRRALLLTPTHLPKPSVANVLVALRDAPGWQGVLAYDELALATMVMSPPPWLHGANKWEPRRWNDSDDVLATEWLHRQKIMTGITTTPQAVGTVAKENSFHPVQDYLNGLIWDKTGRLDTFTATYLGSPDTSYHAAVGKCMFVAAVARIMRPGCKVDHIPILEGPQGTFKSTALRELFEPWFSDDLSELGSKDSKMEMNGIWCLEIAELASMRKGEVERIKAFASRNTDRYRPSYGRHVVEAPRQCVLIGTTNADNYLKDETGARRFWPIRCNRIDLARLSADRDQIWAEAVSLYKAGTEWWLTDDHDIEAAALEQDERFDADPWTDEVARIVLGKDETSVAAVLSFLKGEAGEWEQRDQNRVVACLKAQRCWERKQVRREGERKWVYLRTKVVTVVTSGDAEPVEN